MVLLHDRLASCKLQAVEFASSCEHHMPACRDGVEVEAQKYDSMESRFEIPV